jgi:hypothetical protein
VPVVAELRVGLIWLAAGAVGMASLLVVALYGLAAGLLTMLAASAPLLAGTSVRAQLTGISGLLCGFGCLWLFLAAGQLVAGVNPGSFVGGYNGLFAVGVSVVIVGATLGALRITRLA